jgi:hypothetical protein
MKRIHISEQGTGMMVAGELIPWFQQTTFPPLYVRRMNGWFSGMTPQHPVPTDISAPTVLSRDMGKDQLQLWG